MNRWQEIWNKRESTVQEQLRLEDLLRLDGFDTGAGAISIEVWQSYVNRRANELGLTQGMSVFEIGCGAGAFSFPLHERGCLVAGADYSASLVAAATQAMPRGKWHVAAADQLTLASRTFEAVVSNSVFHYFSDQGYARRVLARMMEAARTAVGVFDVPDARLADEAAMYRQAALGKAEYKRRYAGLLHLSFTPEWFQKLAPIGWDVMVMPQDMAEYGNSRYRFNVIMKRHG